LIELFTKWKDDTSRHFHDRDLCEHFLKILGEHKFWNQQAIVTPDKNIKKAGEIKKFKPEDIPDEPVKLPPGFVWGEFDVDNDEQVAELQSFLEQHYVEDPQCHFRLKYSPDKIRWAVTSPGFKKELHFVARNEKNGKLMACLMGVPKKLVLLGKNVNVCEVNFLAVHRKLREKRMAQIVIQEMMRRKRKLGFG
jgi:glycylpeptide N-tetradecanoyltransferase